MLLLLFSILGNSGRMSTSISKNNIVIIIIIIIIITMLLLIKGFHLAVILFYVYETLAM